MAPLSKSGAGRPHREIILGIDPGSIHTGWGLIETATLIGVTLSDFDVLRILSGADYLHAFEANRLQALARLSAGKPVAHFVYFGVMSVAEVLLALWETEVGLDGGLLDREAAANLPSGLARPASP